MTVSDIARQLGEAQQNIHHHSSRFVKAGIIAAEGNTSSTKYRLTEVGKNVLMVVKESCSGPMPIRMHNCPFLFVAEAQDELQVNWIPIGNGTSRYTQNYQENDDLPEGRVDIIKGQNEHCLTLRAQCRPHYGFDQFEVFFAMYQATYLLARRAAEQYRLKLLDNGRHERRPEIAFENDRSVRVFAMSAITKYSTKEGGKVWNDNSNGEEGEVETNDATYLEKYFRQPEAVYEMWQMINEMYRNFKSNTSQK